MAIDGDLGWTAAESPSLAGDGLLRDDDRSGGDAVPALDRAAARAWLIGTTLAALLLTTWFFIAWLALDRHIIDAASESVGSAFALLLVVSVVGAVRHQPGGPGGPHSGDRS